MAPKRASETMVTQMNTLPIQAVALNPLALRAFHPDPGSGTLYGPTMDITQGDAQATRLITDGAAAADVELCTALAIEEAHALAAIYQGRGVKPPWPIPAKNLEGTPWFMDSCAQGSSWGAAHFFSPEPHRALEIDLRSPGLSIYTYKILCEAGEATQSIIVSASESVETNYYAFRIHAQNDANALELALGLASAVYRSRQYDMAKELGPLRYRQGDEESWRLVPRTRGGFLPPKLGPEASGGLMLASARSVFETEGFAQPVAAIEIRPSKEGDGTRQVDLCLHRPPERSRRLMPLAPKLQKVLWTPIFQSIFRR
ncbi:MAG TPA: hypothetical protein VLJ37_02910 [bacterium]|nr:hypothetical protein [bacterium]